SHHAPVPKIKLWPQRVICVTRAAISECAWGRTVPPTSGSSPGKSSSSCMETPRSIDRLGTRPGSRAASSVADRLSTYDHDATTGPPLTRPAQPPPAVHADAQIPVPECHKNRQSLTVVWSRFHGFPTAPFFPITMSDGEVFAGRYELGMVLGRGAMAEVRAGWDRRLGRAVAVKTLLPDLAGRPAVRRSFEGEARAAARLAHPNAVAVFDVGEDDGVPFLVMEQLLGPTLEHEPAGGPLDAGRVRRLGGELLAALGAAHAAGLVHRDVKPANVLMTPDGSAKLADFGIAKAVVGEGAATEMDLTATGQVFGTVAYIAPEPLTGRRATVQSDVYSVGVVLYESLSGSRPFAAATPVDLIRAIDLARPVPLRQRCPGLDAALVSA